LGNIDEFCQSNILQESQIIFDEPNFNPFDGHFEVKKTSDQILIGVHNFAEVDSARQKNFLIAVIAFS
jgi:hypothetical protein